jgi:hypothetical protein
MGNRGQTGHSQQAEKPESQLDSKVSAADDGS